MIINHNMSAIFSQRQLKFNNIASDKGMEKLSSGLRINRAGDDASGLAVSEKMRAQISGLNAAQKIPRMASR
jgi:flagellin